MTYLQIYQRVCQEMGETAAGSVDTKYGFWINEAQRRIANAYKFTWRFKRGVIQIVAEYTAGTVTTNGTSTIAGSGTTFTAAMVGRRFTVEGDGQRYYISAYVSAAEITLDRAVQRANASGLTYSIRKIDYSLPSDCEELISLRYEGTPIKLYRWDMQNFEQAYPKDDAYGDPTWYLPTGRDSSGNLMVRFFPVPTSLMSFDLLYLKSLTDLSSSGDVSSVPIKYHDALVYYTLIKSFSYYNDATKAAEANAEYNSILADMVAADKNDADDLLVFKSVESSRGLKVPTLPLDNYTDSPYLGGD